MRPSLKWLAQNFNVFCMCSKTVDFAACENFGKENLPCRVQNRKPLTVLTERISNFLLNYSKFTQNFYLTQQLISKEEGLQGGADY